MPAEAKREGIESLGNGVTGSYEPPSQCSESISCPLEEQLVLLTTTLSQALWDSFIYMKLIFMGTYRMTSLTEIYHDNTHISNPIKA